MIHIRPWIDNDLEIINLFLVQHGHKKCLQNEMPKNGFIAFDSEGIIAAGGLALSEGFGFIDCYVTNKLRPMKTRYHALNILTETLLERAKELGTTKIMGVTKNTGILKHVKNFGFKEQREYTVITKEIETVT